MLKQGLSFFEGLTDEEIAELASRLAQRRFPAGTTVLAAGDQLLEIYIIQSGQADILVLDRHGAEHCINRIGPGSTFGEMSFFTGDPASATVRAVEELEVLALSQSDFPQIAADFPRIYRNLGAILSERLARTNQLTLREPPGHVSLLLDHGAPPLLGYALACSLAWHTRSAVLQVVLTDRPVPAEMAALADTTAETAFAFRRKIGPGGPAAADVRAHLLVTPLTGPFAPDSLARTLDNLGNRYTYVQVQVEGGRDLPRLNLPRVVLVGPQKALPPAAEDPPRFALRGWVEGRVYSRPSTDKIVAAAPLGPADEQALARGQLPTTTPAGRAIGWAARDLAGLKLGLALGGGTEKGYAHIGVLRVLRRVGVEVDYLSGTSIGSIVGALFALGMDPDEALLAMDDVARAAFRLHLPFRSILSNSALRAGFRRIAGENRIEDLRIPFGVVAADILTGRELVFRRGLLWQAVLASCALPGVYPPQRIGPYLAVDGGALNPVPSNVAADMGADKVIAVKLADTPPAAPLEAEAVLARGRCPWMLQTIMRSIDIMYNKVEAVTAHAATILIEPDFQNRQPLGIRNFSQGRCNIPMGEAAAEAALPRLAAAFPWLRG
jgi:NTE family protein